MSIDGVLLARAKCCSFMCSGSHRKSEVLDDILGSRPQSPHRQQLRQHCTSHPQGLNVGRVNGMAGTITVLCAHVCRFEFNRFGPTHLLAVEFEDVIHHSSSSIVIVSPDEL